MAAAPADNPFFAAGAAMGGEVGANIQKIFSYGHRNGFGMAFDPYSGGLWETENADDAFSELNRVDARDERRLDPDRRAAQPPRRLQAHRDDAVRQRHAAGALSADARRLHRRRWPCRGCSCCRARSTSIPSSAGSTRSVRRARRSSAGTRSGPEYNGTLWIGSARSFQQVGGTGGSLYRFRLTADRLHVDVSADPRLADRVADNLFRATKFDGTESETLIVGQGFGTTTDIEQGPDGNLYVVSITDNAIYRISRKP